VDISAILLKPTREWTKEERNILTAEIKKFGRQRLKNLRIELQNDN
jgi:hypothetical protein